jgi:hypothetical protein
MCGAAGMKVYSVAKVQALAGLVESRPINGPPVQQLCAAGMYTRHTGAAYTNMIGLRLLHLHEGVQLLQLHGGARCNSRGCRVGVPASAHALLFNWQHGPGVSCRYWLR